MTIMELIEQIQKVSPKALNGIPKRRAARLVRDVFKHITRTLARTEEGVLTYGGLGRFRVRKVDREVQGKRVRRTQVIFRRAEPAVNKGKEANIVGD